jgi:hypothetical protein
MKVTDWKCAASAKVANGKLALRVKVAPTKTAGPTNVADRQFA